ncbi:uncharacterized protein [Musca autumnalis]|uniref:uncharacterized protein n=1 Tax=Musca autumnalis TaxID=221902 RepID=UPI003CFB96B2
MSENLSIKTEPNDCKQEDSNNGTYTLSCKTRKLENFKNMENDIKEEHIDLDNMEEFLPENVDIFTIDVIKKEDVDEMDTFLAEDSRSCYPLSSLTSKSDDRMEVTAHDVVQHHQHVTEQHHTNTNIQQISLPKLEIIDVHTDERSVISSSSVPEIRYEHECEICGRRYRESRILRAHIKNMHPSYLDFKYICEICNQKFTTPTGLNHHSLRMHRGDHSIQTRFEHKCEICHSSYLNKTSLRKHLREKHHSSIDTEYICEICNQKFTKQKGLNKHYYWMHRETQLPTKHKCEICGRYYGESKVLQAHIRNKHPSSIDSEYICEICNQRFITQKGLDKHSYMTHTAAHSTQRCSKHKCELCHSSYINKTSLRKHIREKHHSSIDTEYICKICNQRFTTPKGLKTHSYRSHPESQIPTKHE